MLFVIHLINCWTNFYFVQRFDLQLAKLGVDVSALKESPKTRTFRAWVEDWEKEQMFVNDPVAKARILNKYKGLVFYDQENGVRQVMSGTELEWRRKNMRDKNSYSGWYLVSIDEKNEEWPWEICQEVCDMLAVGGPAQKMPNFQMVPMHQKTSQNC